MKVDLVVTHRASFPKLLLGKETMAKVGEAVAASILRNIQGQKQTDGSTLKQNAISTQQRKRDQGKPVLSLVDEEHRFVKGGGGSWKIMADDGRVVIAPATPDLGRLNRLVQMKGYRGWFGISEAAKRVIRALIKTRLHEIIKQAVAKQGRAKR